MDLSKQIGRNNWLPSSGETSPQKVAIKSKRCKKKTLLLILWTPRVSHERKKPTAPVPSNGDLLTSKVRLALYSSFLGLALDTLGLRKQNVCQSFGDVLTLW